MTFAHRSRLACIGIFATALSAACSSAPEGTEPAKGSNSDETSKGTSDDKGKSSGDSKTNDGKSTDDTTTGAGTGENKPDDKAPADTSGKVPDATKALASLSTTEAANLCTDILKRFSGANPTKTKKGACSILQTIASVASQAPRDEAVTKCKADLATCIGTTAPAGTCDGAQIVRCAGTVADYQKCADDWSKLYTSFADVFTCEGVYDDTFVLPSMVPESCDTLFKGCQSEIPE